MTEKRPSRPPFSSEPQNTNSGFAKTQRRSSVFELSNLRFIAYEDVGTKSNVAALAVFGVLGLGARRSWTLITVGFTDREAQFLVRAPVHEVRSLFRQGALSSQSLHSLLIEGEPPSIQSKPSEDTDDRQPSHLSELERLAKLYTDGMLTEDEFSRMKEKLLDDPR